MQILILGMHRSGTSATARLINMMGAYFAPEGMALPAKPDNPKGFWERRDVLHFNDELLKLQGCQWNQLASWDFAKASQVPENMKRLMHSLIMNMDAHRPWFIKDPRMCLTLPAWTPLLESPLAVVVYRNPQEIAISLDKRNPLMAEYGIALWEFYTVGLLNASRAMPRVFVRHEDILEKPVKRSEELLKQLTQLGVRRLVMPSAQEVRAFIDPRLHRSKPAGEKNLPALSSQQQELAAILQGQTPQTSLLSVSQQSVNLIRNGLPKPLSTTA
jgi:hypothetical protein